MKKIQNREDTNKNRDRMLKLYDDAPYPEVLGGKSHHDIPLLIHWINAVGGQNKNALANEKNFLVAGCGSGLEVFTLAELFPDSKVVGVDYSANSISKAKELAKTKHLKNIHFEIADLMTSEWHKNHESFDFILCSAVADYVVNPNLLLIQLAACLTENGVLCLMANSPHHPAGRIRDAFEKLGISPDQFNDNPQQRSLLKLTSKLIGTAAMTLGIENAAKAYLDVDIFPPIAHHDDINVWCQRAQNAGLHFSGSMDALYGLAQVSDEQIPMLYSMGKASLSLWMAHLLQMPSMQMLFTRKALIEPKFHDTESLMQWKPKLDSSLGMLPALGENTDESRNLTLRFQGLPDFIIHSNAFDLEVLRRCNGKTSIGQIMNDIGVGGKIVSLRACLFRMYHYGLLSS